ncbi:potassium channel family protein [Defluviimonas sp. WL0024]|uniref:Potassium channel family protein n=2 Tax=Albidovulum TaxID=205889 RepID=A0ABT3J8M6_9RHOB|nr:MULTISPECIES: potassium channel family protein [Defluviimonas]MCU9849791.1 potassium channel family protein [Defluviimonas sp. WL0024]MCW3784036.1 potassium channel family protein [Defluviimonas salinarum]
MVPFFLTLARLFRAIRRSWGDPAFRTTVTLVFATVLSGTVFYHNVEGWSWLDALYFCVATMSTVGYGDFAPQTDAGKIFTIAFMLLGIGLFVALVGQIANALIRRKE